MADKVKYGFQIIGMDGSVIDASGYDYETAQEAVDAGQTRENDIKAKNPVPEGIVVTRQDGQRVTNKDFAPTEPETPTLPV